MIGAMTAPFYQRIGMAGEALDDRDAAASVDILGLAGSGGWHMVYWWVSVRTTGAGSGLQIDGTGVDTNGAPLIMSADGATRTIDGSSADCQTGTWLIYIDGTSPCTLDIGYFSPFSDMRYDYNVQATAIFQV